MEIYTKSKGCAISNLKLIRGIARHVADKATPVGFSRIKGRERTREVSTYRTALAAALYNEGFSITLVGDCLDRDHSTITYLRYQAGSMMQTDLEFRKVYNRIEQAIEGYRQTRRWR